MPIDEKQILFKMGTIYMRSYMKYKDFDSLLERFYKLPFTNKISFTMKKYDYNNNFKILPEHILRCDLKGREVNKYFNLKQYAI